MRHFAVLGSPIEHSLSPTLHDTAYRVLGLDYDYERIEVESGSLADFIDGLDESWSGLSLTMPLKREVIPLLDDASPLVSRLGVANTLVIDDGRLIGHNTDVDGIVRAITSMHDVRHEQAVILGGGATAASALAAAAVLDASSAVAYLRDPAKAGELADLAATLALPLEVLPLAAVGESGEFDFVISTLPGGTPLPALPPENSQSVLLDVAYSPWPSPLAASWQAAGAGAVSGLDMLVEQAIGQVRLFTGLPQNEPLAGEDEIRQSMREAVGLPPVARPPGD